MQQAISALYSLLQTTQGLIADVAEAGSNSKQALQRLYALYDETQPSVAVVPDIQIFASNSTGTPKSPNFHMQHQHVQLHGRLSSIQTCARHHKDK